MIYQVLAPVLSVIAIAAIMLGTAAASGDLSTGKAVVRHGTASGVVPCMACHGLRLQGNAAIGAPALAGAPQDQTLTAFDAIADNKIGDNYVMRTDARSLSPWQRKAVADYLRSLRKSSIALPVIAPNPSSAGIIRLSTGAEIVQHGTSAGVAPCATCHGSLLQGDTSLDAPALAGMPENRTLSALDAIAADRTGKTDTMRNIARLLTPTQRKAVAAFLARVEPANRHHDSGTAKTQRLPSRKSPEALP